MYASRLALAWAIRRYRRALHREPVLSVCPARSRWADSAILRSLERNRLPIRATGPSAALPCSGELKKKFKI